MDSGKNDYMYWTEIFFILFILFYISIYWFYSLEGGRRNELQIYGFIARSCAIYSACWAYGELSVCCRGEHPVSPPCAHTHTHTRPTMTHFPRGCVGFRLLLTWFVNFVNVTKNKQRSKETGSPLCASTSLFTSPWQRVPNLARRWRCFFLVKLTQLVGFLWDSLYTLRHTHVFEKHQKKKKHVFQNMSTIRAETPRRRQTS